MEALQAASITGGAAVETFPGAQLGGSALAVAHLCLGTRVPQAPGEMGWQLTGEPLRSLLLAVWQEAGLQQVAGWGPALRGQCQPVGSLQE